MQNKWPVHLLVTPIYGSMGPRDFIANSKHQTPAGLARQFARFYSDRKFLVADEEYAAKGTRFFNWGPEKNRIEDVETSHAIIPQNLIRINAGENAGSD